MTRDMGYTIRAMAARCRMTAHTLRYYERVGLIQAVERGRNGHRRYSDADEAWLKFLQSLRATQMPIREIQRYAALQVRGAGTTFEQRKILEEHRAALEKQIIKLRRAVISLTAHLESPQTDKPTVGHTPALASSWETETLLGTSQQDTAI